MGPWVVEMLTDTDGLTILEDSKAEEANEGLDDRALLSSVIEDVLMTCVSDMDADMVPRAKVEAEELPG